MEKIMLPLGRRLKELRKERKLKQKEMPGFWNVQTEIIRKWSTERLTFPD